MTKERVEHFNGPQTVDLLITDKCQMNCVCFRPPDSGPHQSLSLSEWKRIITSCHSIGTRQIVFSGGEPLLYEGLLQILQYTKSLGLQTTLSTNAILFGAQHQDMMPFVDEIGIPLDGPTPKMNGLMRPPGELNQFQKAIEAIQIVQRLYPAVELTVRTVVSAANWREVELIPERLKGEGIEPGSYRWKLYQFNPAVSDTLMPRVKDLLLSTEDFLSVWSSLQERYTGIPHWFSFFPVIVAIENNLLVYPDGQAMVLVRTSPTKDKTDLLPSTQYMSLGNLVTGFDEAMVAWHQRTKT